MIEIRQENNKDYEEVYNVVKMAFESAKHSDGNEQDLVVDLRKSKNFIPKLSLVAIYDDKIVGYILFTKIKIGKSTELALAPLAVFTRIPKTRHRKKANKRRAQNSKKIRLSFFLCFGK